MRLIWALPLALGACMTLPSERAVDEMSMADAVAVEEARAQQGSLFRPKPKPTGADPIEPLSVVQADLPNDPDMPVVETALVDTKPPEPGGLLGLFRRAKADADVPDDPDAKATVLTDGADGEAQVELAALSPDAGDKLADPVPPAPLGFGHLQAVCGTRTATMGKEVAHWPETGKKVFRVFDSAPGSTALRTFHITGFKDRCPRRFRATLVFFGAPSTYEALRLDSANQRLLTTETDQAYAKLMRRTCGVGPAKPCPAEKLDKLDQKMVFLSAYDRFGTVTRWTEVLLHDKDVAAVAVKSR